MFERMFGEGKLARRLAPELLERVRAFPLRDEGHGFDRFGLSRDGVARALAITAPLYERWFRVVSRGIEHLPHQGPAILAANHSGTLPFDAMMVWADVARRSLPARIARAVTDTFVAGMPLVNLLFTRGGAIGGNRANVETLLEGGELLLVFPEGVPGISKPFRERYRLRPFRVGHAELAIRFGAPVVPVAVIGAEEQMPLLTSIRGVRLFGSPIVPVPLVPAPLPVRYHIHYGEPIALGARPADADDPAVVRAAAERVQAAVAALVANGLRERQGIFR
jgi:1-acyl-sn-glycerol-3-phosphate acyltransferase